MFSLGQYTFQRARFKLTLFYMLISLLLLVIFSIAALNAEKHSLERIEQLLSNKEQRPHLTALLEKRIEEFQSNFIKRLLFLNLILLITASFTSYFLSGRTLKPIREMLLQQEMFSADASHELRTPLTTIGMEIEALKRTTKNMPENYKETFNSIQEEIYRMRKIVNGLLFLVRNETDPQRVGKVFDIVGVIGNAIKQIGPLADKKQVKMAFKNTNKVNMYGSEDQIKQVFLILLDNAIKYNQQKGIITILVSSQRNTFLVEVSDTGIGIPKKNLSLMFSRFYRGDQNINSKEGTGLGLSIAKKIIENHRGKISASSALGKGSKFTIELPYNS